jgi:PAS domain S-box-containing protein
VILEDITIAEKVVGITLAAGGAFWAMWVNVISPILGNINAKRQADQEKFDQMYHVLIGSNGSSVKSRLERMELRQILHESSNKALMNSLHIGYWKSDKEGNCIEASRTLCSIMQRTEEEIIGNNWASWLHPDCKERVFKAWKFAVENGTEFNEEYTYLLPNGGTVRVKGTAYQLVDDHGKKIGLFGTLNTIE